MTTWQFECWQHWISDYCDKKQLPDDIFQGYYCNEDGDCEESDATHICIEVWSVYKHDYDILYRSISDIPFMNMDERELYDGDGEYQSIFTTVNCKIYGYKFPLTK